MQLSVKRKIFYTNHNLTRSTFLLYVILHSVNLHEKQHPRRLLGAYQTIIKDESCELAL